MMNLISVLRMGTIFFVFVALALVLTLADFELVFGQELLPQPGTNQSLGIPNTNTTPNPNRNPAPPLPGSPLSPFLK
jgi:hypothetical protein